MIIVRGSYGQTSRDDIYVVQNSSVARTKLGQGNCLVLEAPAGLTLTAVAARTQVIDHSPCRVSYRSRTSSFLLRKDLGGTSAELQDLEILMGHRPAIVS